MFLDLVAIEKFGVGSVQFLRTFHYRQDKIQLCIFKLLLVYVLQSLGIKGLDVKLLNLVLERLV